MTNQETQEQESSRVQISHAVLSDIGKRREENQDSFGIIEGDAYKLFIVADGMGGVRGGALASSLAVETVKQSVEGISHPSTDDIVLAIQRANMEIFAKGASDPSLSGMGTTLVALFFSGSKLTVFNVGDSRAYRFRGEQIARLSEDHTLVMELLRSGTIDAEQAKNHPVSHMLTRSLGPAEEVEVDVLEVTDGPFENDIFLICSDGLYNLVKDGEMLAMVQENHLEQAAEKLVNLANKRGGTDNITVVVAETGLGFPELPEELRTVSYDEAESEKAAELVNAAQAEEEESLAESPKGPESAPADPATSEAPNETKKDEPHSETEHAKVGTNGSGPHTNGSASLEGRLSIEQLRSAYAEAKNQSKPDPKAAESKNASQPEKTDIRARLARSGAQSKSKSPRPSVLGTSEQKSALSPRVYQILSLLAAAICGSMVSVVILSPESSRNSGALNSSDSRRGAPRSPEGRSDSSAVGGENTAGQDKTASSNAGLTITGSIEGGLSTIERRQHTLSNRLRQVDEKLAALDAPLSGQIGQLLNEATKQLEVLDQRLVEVRGEVDAAARRLAVWTGRRKRLETSEPINMVAEVAVSSEEVRKKKEAFESATWQYLKEAERLEYTPNDRTLSDSVANLVRLRNDRMGELVQSLRAAIDNGVLDSQQRISDQTVERDRIEAEMRDLQDTIAFSKLLASGDRNARTAKRADLARERELILAELNELNRLADTLPALRGDGSSGVQDNRRR